MFFSISKEKKDNYPNNTKLGYLFVNTDNGWMFDERDQWQFLYKGYADSAPLTELLDVILESKVPSLLGNFCVIAYNKKDRLIYIKTDLYRSFPIYVDKTEITNLIKYDNVVWTNNQITINAILTPTVTAHDVSGMLDETPLSVDVAIQLITDILNKKTEAFVQNNTLPVRVFLSGGVDSLLVYSFIKKYTTDYEMVNYSHIDYDHFWLNNHSTIANSWGYTQIHHWKDSCVLTSGAPGDEFMMRSPTTIDMLLKWNGIDTLQLLPKFVDSLHYDYYCREKHLRIFTEQQTPLCDDIKRYICEILLNDWQHWHLGNTLTWTPLRDLEITKILLRIPINDLIPQMMDSEISKKIIENNSPNLSRVISDKKNTGNYMSNLADFYEKLETKL